MTRIPDPNFFINFIVVSPQPEYVSYIGGITVAHTLANAIAKTGENVYLYANSTKEDYNVNCIPWGSDLDFDPNNTVVVLIAGAGEHTFLHNIPDILTKAPNIVRWLVNHQVKPYPQENKFYKFHKYWDVLEGQEIDGYLSVIEIDQELFKPSTKPRKGICYYAKGNLDEEAYRAIHKPEDHCIDNVLYNLPEQDRMKYLAEVFSTSELFIVYSHLTTTAVLAALCGCPTLIIPKKGVDKDKWLNEIWCSKYGLALGVDDMPRALETLPLVPGLVKDYIDTIQPQEVELFIQDCYDWLYTKYTNN
jgi:hypothetical protein